MKIIITPIIALLLAACSQTDDAASIDGASAKAAAANQYEKEGIRCVKKSGPTETTTYLGLVSIDNIIYTGLRTETVVSIGSDSMDMGASLVLDDGGKMETYALMKEGMMTVKPAESAYPPSDIETSIMMAKHIHGDCKSWAVNPDMFQRPKK